MNERERELEKEPERGGGEDAQACNKEARKRTRGSLNGDTPRGDSLCVSLYYLPLSSSSQGHDYRIC